MFGSLVGLLVVGAAFVPGYVYLTVRRRMVPMARSSRPLESAQVVVASLGANALALLTYGTLRLWPWLGGHSPSLAELIRDPKSYTTTDDARLMWVCAWAVLVVAAAVTLAWALAHRLWLPDKTVQKFTPVIKDASAWYRAFDAEAPKNSRVLVVCHMADRHIFGGHLAWYNTDTEETDDRDLVLAPPFLVMSPESTDNSASEDGPMADEGRMILSARNILRIDVIYLKQDSGD